MVIEVASANRFQMLKMKFAILRRIAAICIGLLICAAGLSVMFLPQFETESASVMMALIGGSLLVLGTIIARVGSVRQPVDLAFDRQTEEWKLASLRGRKVTYERVAPRGSVLNLTGRFAAMTDGAAAPLFSLHLDSDARTKLLDEHHRLAAAR